MTGFRNNPKSSEIGHLFCMIFVVYLGHGICHPVAVLFFFQSVFGRGLKLPNQENLRKKVVCTHLYRSTGLEKNVSTTPLEKIFFQSFFLQYCISFFYAIQYAFFFLPFA